MHTTKPQGPDITQLNIEILFQIKQKKNCCMPSQCISSYLTTTPENFGSHP